MRSEHLREWMQYHQATEAVAEVEARGETLKPEGRDIYTEESIEDRREGRNPTKWEKVVELVHIALHYGVLAEEASWQAVVLIPKGGGDYRGIGLVEVMWKAMAVILNRRFTASITYHDFLQGFWAGRGAGTATLEFKLIQHIADFREAVPHAIYLDLHKAYDSLDSSRCLDILEGYGVGTRDLCLLRRYWERLKMVEQAGGYYREPFCVDRGVTQGNPLAPTIFNVVVDVVVRHWESLVAERGWGSSADDIDTAQTAGRTIQEQDAGRWQGGEGHARLTVKAELFYTDNGLVDSTDPGWPQFVFDMLTGLFN